MLENTEEIIALPLKFRDRGKWYAGLVLYDITALEPYKDPDKEYMLSSSYGILPSDELQESVVTGSEVIEIIRRGFPHLQIRRCTADFELSEKEILSYLVSRFDIDDSYKEKNTIVFT